MARKSSTAIKISKPSPVREIAASSRLLEWYDRHRRVLPWRALPGETADPYAVWLSEIMLQQTTVAAVKAYYVTFLSIWPDVAALAAAPVEEIMKRWAGLGYYSRARNLHACAQAVVAVHGGRFPSNESALRGLPGVGPYTAAAIAAIAFDQRAVVIDGNVDRVIVRRHGIEQPVALAKPEIRRLADEATPFERPGDYAQAMMDLGATICTPRKPACVICPLAHGCVARNSGRQEALPAKAVKAVRPLRLGSVFYVRRGGEVLVRTRPPKGLLGGMTEFPSSAWDADGDPKGNAAPLKSAYRKLPVLVVHVFTHFELRLMVFVASVSACTPAPEGCRWVPEAGLAGEALPGLMRKVEAAAVGDL
jgi:A/G-specific adenine glycosylase